LSLAVAEAPRAAAHVRAFAREAADYPPGLQDLSDAPARLFVLGDAAALALPAVAIVGARGASAYGLALAERLARDLAAMGIVIVSGLARGIDAAAHQGALAAGGRTIAVLPCGIDRVVPPEHAALAQRITAAGALVSELERGAPFGRGAFVRRNRLVAALSQATVVVEAAEGSGALSTAKIARKLARPLLACPGDVDRPGSMGTLALLRAGARIAADAGDVMAMLSPKLPVWRARSAAAADDPLAALLAALGETPSTLEMIAQRAQLSLPELQALLLQLEWSGMAVREPGQRWRRR
jgi:DNA processing protein